MAAPQRRAWHAIWTQAGTEGRAATIADPVATILGTGLSFGQLVRSPRRAVGGGR